RGGSPRPGSAGHFGTMVKPAAPVGRPRPLFTGRVAFMTAFADPAAADPPLAVVQAEPGLIAAAPSAGVGPLPRQRGARLRRGPDRDPDGPPLWLAAPSPCPP